MHKLASSLTAAVFLWCATAFAADPAPDFSLPTDKGTVTLSSLKGQVVYVDFWASWCGPCRKSFPWMNELLGKYGKQGFTIVAINLDTDRDLIDKFLSKYHADFTLAYNPKGDVAEAYRVQGMPSSYLIDRNGLLRGSHIGFRETERDNVEAEIRNLLQESAAK